MKRFRKYTAGLLLLVLVLGVSACGNSDNNGGTGNGTTPGTENTTDKNPGTNETTKPGSNSIGNDGNIVDDAVDGAGDAIEDVGDGIMNGVDDVVDGTENVVDDMTGTTNQTNSNTGQMAR